MPYFTLHLPNGNSEEIACEDIYEWFRLRGAKNSEAVEKAADECWNFYSADLEIENYREPATLNPRITPNV